MYMCVLRHLNLYVCHYAFIYTFTPHVHRSSESQCGRESQYCFQCNRYSSLRIYYVALWQRQCNFLLVIEFVMSSITILVMMNIEISAECISCYTLTRLVLLW